MERQDTWENPEPAPLTPSEVAGAELVGQSDKEFSRFQGEVSFFHHFLNADAPRLVGAVSHLFTRLNDRIEKAANEDSSPSLVLASSGYQEPQPRALARAAGLIKPLDLFLREGLQSKTTRINKLETKNDLERIGSAKDFFCGLFWEEIASVRERELDSGVLEKFSIMWDMDRAACESRYGSKEMLIREKGWLIHGVKAKAKSNGKMAFYMVYVEAQREADFIKALDGTYSDTIDLDDYGDIVTTCYADTFFENKTNLSRQRLLDLVSAYKRLAVGDKTFYIPASFEGASFPNKQISEHNKLAFNELLGTDVEELPKALDKFFDDQQRGFIGDEKTSLSKPLSADEGWALIDTYARENPGKPVSDYAKRVLERVKETAPSEEKPATDIPPLPKKAPERWPSNPSKRTENPAEFATRVYRVWMDAEMLTRQELKSLDPLLFASIDNWLKNNRRKPKPEPLPEGFKLLTTAQVNDAWVERVRSGKTPLPTDPDELARFAHALQYRGQEL